MVVVTEHAEKTKHIIDLGMMWWDFLCKRKE